jgi:hypothetical protein
MIKQKTYMYATGALLFMLCSFLGFAYMYLTVYTAGSLLTAQIIAIEQNVSKEKMVTDLELAMAKTKEERNAIGAFVLTEDKTSVFLTDIEKVAATQKVALTTNSLEVVKPVKKVASGTTTPQTQETTASLFDTLAISFLIEGQEDDVKKMLHVFETLPYHSTVNMFSLKREAGGYAKGTLNLSVSLLK